MATYNATWKEYHSVMIEAKDKNEAAKKFAIGDYHSGISRDRQSMYVESLTIKKLISKQ